MFASVGFSDMMVTHRIALLYDKAGTFQGSNPGDWKVPACLKDWVVCETACECKGPILFPILPLDLDTLHSLKLSSTNGEGNV